MYASMRSSMRLGLMGLLLAALCCSGCASKYGAQTTPVNYYPQCYKPIGDLRADENATNKATAGGAVGGALLGALIGGLATGKVEGAVIGAAAGGAGGAMVGHAYGTSQAKARNEEAMRTYVAQLGSEAAEMDRATVAAKVACQCYDQQFKQAVAEVKAGRMDKLELSRRYEEIRAGLEETSRILNTTAQGMAQKDAEYQKVLAEEQALSAETLQTQPKPHRSRAGRTQQTERLQTVASTTDQWQQSRNRMQQQQRAAERQNIEYQNVLTALDV